MKYTDYLQSHPKGFEDIGCTGVSKQYIGHLMKFSQMIRPNHSFTHVMRASAQVSPSVRYHILSEYCKRNAGKMPKEVMKQCDAIKKELKNVILFPKEARVKTNQKKANIVELLKVDRSVYPDIPAIPTDTV